MMKTTDRTEKWMGDAGWSENPFTLKINPTLFVGYNDQLDRLNRHLREGHKLAMITGPTGSGKTTLMLLIKEMFSRDGDIIYLAKPPKMEELVSIFTDVFRPSIFERMRGVNVHVHNLPDYVNRKSRRDIVLMVDEIHESDVEVLEWLRTLNDHIGNMQIVMSGLPTTDDFLRRNLETLRNRITTSIELTSLDESETYEFIKKRIESVGGKGIAPFDEETVRQVYRRTGGFPREILKLCSELLDREIDGRGMDVSEAIEEVRREVPQAAEPTARKEAAPDADDSDESETPPQPETPRKSETYSIDKDFMRDIPAKQRRILKILSQNNDMYPSEVADAVGIDKYKSKQHAVRSMNNILQRLMHEGYVQRSPRGKGFVYYLEPKVRSVLTEA